MLIESNEYCRKHVRIPLNYMCSESRDLFKFWQVSDVGNVSITVQDTDKMTIEIICGLTNGTNPNALE